MCLTHCRRNGGGIDGQTHSPAFKDAEVGKKLGAFYRLLLAASFNLVKRFSYILLFATSPLELSPACSCAHATLCKPRQAHAANLFVLPS